MDANSELSVTYFRGLVESETQILKGLSTEWNSVIKTTSDIPEEVLGDIMVAIGQAELLMKERFSQFTGLIDDCEFNRGEKTITCQDLQGFWDIIFFQIEDIRHKFNKLSTKKTNNWKEAEPKQPVKVMKKKVFLPKPLSTKPSTVKPKTGGGIRAHILAARQKMMAEKKDIENENIKPVEIKKATENHANVKCLVNGNEQMQEENNVTEDLRNKKNRTPLKTRTEDKENKENSSPEKLVFDAGFFRVETPVKKPVLTTPPFDNKITTPVKSEQKVLSSSVLRERIANSPRVHKDYSPCMRITRSMKAKGVEPVTLNL